MNKEDIQVVIPGEIVQNELIKKANIKNKVTLGPGLKRRADDVVTTKCGILRSFTSPNTLWIDCLQKQYTPVTNETVVGIVTKKVGDYFKVDIQAADQALLHFLSFEGATKKNRPEISVGDLIFGRLIVVSQDMEPELVCVTVNGKKERFRVLPNEGLLFRVSLHLVRKILSSSCPMLPSLGQAFSFESAVGMNGLIWIKANSVKETIAICDTILKAESLNPKQIKTLCTQLI